MLSRKITAADRLCISSLRFFNSAQSVKNFFAFGFENARFFNEDGYEFSDKFRIRLYDGPGFFVTFVNYPVKLGVYPVKFFTGIFQIVVSVFGVS